MTTTFSTYRNYLFVIILLLIQLNIAHAQGVSAVKWKELIDHTKSATCLDFSADGQLLISGSSDMMAKVWNCELGTKVRSVRGHVGGILALDFSPNGDLLATCGEDRVIKLWNTKSYEVSKTLIGHNDWVTTVQISPAGKYIASGSKDKTIKIWLPEKGSAIRTFKGHTGTVTSVAFSPKGDIIASGSYDRTIKLWSTITWKELRTLSGHQDGVASIAISPDGKYLASGSYDKTVKIWSLETGEELHTLRSHKAWVRTVVFSPDGQLLASGSRDGTVKVWMVESGDEILTYRAHSDGVNALAINPEGGLIASASMDGTVKLWRLEGWGQIASSNPGAPPNLTASMQLTEPSGNNLLDAEETGAILLTVFNNGNGDAYNLQPKLTIEPISGTRVEKIPVIYRLPAGNKQTISIPIMTTQKLKTGTVTVYANILEENGFDLEDPAVFTFQSQAVTPPELVVFDLGIDDESKNAEFEKREIVTIKARIKNIGSGGGWGVIAIVEAGPDLFITRGAQSEFQLGDLPPGKHMDIEFPVFTNSRTENVVFTIEIREARERYNSVVPFNIAFGKKLKRISEMK